VSDALAVAGSNVKKAASTAADYTVESGKNVYSSAQDGTLKDKTS